MRVLFLLLLSALADDPVKFFFIASQSGEKTFYEHRVSVLISSDCKCYTFQKQGQWQHVTEHRKELVR